MLNFGAGKCRGWPMRCCSLSCGALCHCYLSLSLKFRLFWPSLCLSLSLSLYIYIYIYISRYWSRYLVLVSNVLLCTIWVRNFSRLFFYRNSLLTNCSPSLFSVLCCLLQWSKKVRLHWRSMDLQARRCGTTRFACRRVVRCLQAKGRSHWGRTDLSVNEGVLIQSSFLSRQSWSDLLIKEPISWPIFSSFFFFLLLFLSYIFSASALS